MVRWLIFDVRTPSFYRNCTALGSSGHNLDFTIYFCSACYFLVNLIETLPLKAILSDFLNPLLHNRIEPAALADGIFPHQTILISVNIVFFAMVNKGNQKAFGLAAKERVLKTHV